MLVLSSIQFTSILDFVIMMPLGPQLMRTFAISPQQFGLVVSAYTISAGIVGFGGAFFIDRFDRKLALLTTYGGFTVGTLLCAVAPSYEFLVIARTVAGAFAGTMGAIVFAAVGDAIPDARRGAAMGVIMSSFSVASVAGVPFGLFLANHYGWHMPFFFLGGMSFMVLLVGLKALPPMRNHLVNKVYEHPVVAMKYMLTHRNHLRAFLFMMAMMVAGFSIIPYISPYLVSNVGLPETDLPLVYFFGGGFTIFTARIIGRLSDRFGKARLFTIVASLSIIPILLLTNLPPASLTTIIIVTTVYTVFTSGRMVPSMALITGSVEPQRRGSFMSINSSIQQLSAGVASYGGGLIIGKSSTGTLTGYGTVGIVASVFTVLCIGLAWRIRTVEPPVSHPASASSPQEAAIIDVPV